MIENTYKKRAMFHVVRNANFHIKRQIKNFTQNDSPNLLLVYTASYSIRISSFFKFFTNFLDDSIDIFNIFLSFYHFSMLFNGKFCIFEFFQLPAALCWSTLFVCLSVGMSINFSSLGFMSFLACCFCPIALLTSNIAHTNPNNRGSCVSGLVVIFLCYSMEIFATSIFVRDRISF